MKQNTLQGGNIGLLHGWVDFDIGVPPWCPAAMPLLPDFPPFQVDSATTKPKSTQPSNKPKLAPCTTIFGRHTYLNIHSVWFLKDTEILPIWMSLNFLPILHMTVPYLSLKK